MAFTIALAGKGGTGKTTLAGILIKYMVQHGKTPVLAVDADCNANLNEVLGVAARHSRREPLVRCQMPEIQQREPVDAQ